MIKKQPHRLYGPVRLLLRTDVIQQEMHMDLRDEEARRQWVSSYVDRVFCESATPKIAERGC